LRHHDPYPAAAYDRDGDILMLNRTYAGFFVEAWRQLDMPPLPPLVPYTLTEPPRLNLVSTFFDPAGLRSIVVNWEEMARFALARVRRELGRRDPSSAAALVAMIRAYDGIAELWDELENGAPVPPLQRIHLASAEARCASSSASRASSAPAIARSRSCESSRFTRRTRRATPSCGRSRRRYLRGNGGTACPAVSQSP
jgi:hypothetical protein